MPRYLSPPVGIEQARPKPAPSHYVASGPAPPQPPATRVPETTNARRKFIFVAAPLYWLVWWFAFAMHCMAATFVLGAGLTHFALSVPAIHASTSVLRIPVPLKRMTAVSYLMVAAVHLFAVGHMIQRSIRHGRLSLAAEAAASLRRRSTVLDSVWTTHRNCISRLPSRVRRGYYRAMRAWSRVFGLDGYLGINGPLFTELLVYRELVEIAMQSYQLWSLSLNVTRLWIHNFAVGTVVLNCFSIVLVNKIFHRRETTRRLMHLVVDMYLDFACSVVVPIAVLAPYVMQYDWAKSAYPLPFVLDDVWVANALGEGRQVLVTNYTDFAASLFPQYSIFSCLRILKRLVHRRPTPSNTAHRGAVVPSTPVPMKEQATQAKHDESTPHPHIAIETVEPESRGVRILRACIFLWGVGLLVLHVYIIVGSGYDSLLGCRHYVRPWFATQITCSVLHINCYRRAIDGSANELGAVLRAVDRSVLTKLLFMHCPALTMPSVLVTFPNLIGIEVFNSTIVNWPTEAALRESTHAVMNTVYFARTNLSTIPPGLLHRELPRALTVIAFLHCSLSSVPVDLGDLWAQVRFARVGFESTPVHAIPASVGRLLSTKLWMTDTQIKAFPDGMFATSQFQSIRLSGNPLTHLPDVMGDTSTLAELLVEHTNVAALPSWATSWLDTSDRAASFYGSPVCAPESRALGVAVKSRVCTRDWQSRYGFVPLESIQGKYTL